MKVVRAVFVACVVVVMSLALFGVAVVSVPALRTGLLEYTGYTEHTEHATDILTAPAASVAELREIALSPTAAKNVGLDDATIITITVTDFPKTLPFPAVVTEHVGRSTINVPSPASGVVATIYHEAGVAITPGESLFEITLKQDELLKGQTDYLALLKKRQINAAELERLSQIELDLVPKQHRDLLYQQGEIDLDIKSQRELLIVQGLTDEAITEKLDGAGELIRSLTVVAPHGHATVTTGEVGETSDPLTLDTLYVTVGRNVAVGEPLAQLSDLCELVIRGQVFAANESLLTAALESRSNVTAVFERTTGGRETVAGLYLRSIDNRIDIASGTLQCYIDLENDYAIHQIDGDPPRRYAQWHFKPGQRCELLVEYDVMRQVIVVPIDAVAQDLVETSLFAWVGQEGESRVWRKTPVHLLHKTSTHAVIANDGAIFPGTKVAAKGGSLLNAALEAARSKSATGGGVQHGDHVH